jgi:Sulfotransferase domain
MLSYDDVHESVIGGLVSAVSKDPSSVRRRPSFFLVGAPKAGTTAMNIYLARHPEIFMAKKELHYFSGEAFYDPPLEQRDLAWFLSEFAKAGDKRLLGEASVHYLSSNCAAERIREFDPHAKILIHVRNPSDLIVSYHSEMVHAGYEDIEDLQQALEAEAVRREGQNIPKGCPIPRTLYYADITRLTAQIEHFNLVFGRENVLVNIFDDLEKTPAAVYQNTLAFLGADRTYMTSFEVFNANKVVRSKMVRGLMSEPPELIRRAAKQVLPKPMRRAIRQRVSRMNTRYTQRKPASPTMMMDLKRMFAREVEQLSQLIGRDLTSWSR